jgi:hypothetical protein
MSVEISGMAAIYQKTQHSVRLLLTNDLVEVERSRWMQIALNRSV